MKHQPPVVIITMMDGETRLELVKPILFADAVGSWHSIPAGFVSDGASVPRFLWRLLSPAVDGATLWASIVHDWSYAHAITTRDQCDVMYKKQLIEDGYPRWKAQLTYLGLRLFGASHWHTPEEGT